MSITFFTEIFVKNHYSHYLNLFRLVDLRDHIPITHDPSTNYIRNMYKAVISLSIILMINLKWPINSG